MAGGRAGWRAVYPIARMLWCVPMIAKVFVATVLATEVLACRQPVAGSAQGASPPPAVAKAPEAPAAPPVPAAPAPHVVARTYGVMGTEVTFSLYTADEAKADRAFGAAYDEIRRVERLMTDWERPGEPESDVVLINKAAGKRAVEVSAETMAVIEKSLEMSRRSEGAFDITFAAMRGLWKFDEDMERKLPAPAEVARRRKLINWRDVVVDAKAARSSCAARGCASASAASPRATRSTAAPRSCAARGTGTSWCRRGAICTSRGERGM